MLERAKAGTTTNGGRMGQLPRRRWRIRAPRAFLLGFVGALMGAAGPFLLWWWNMLPPNGLWVMLPPMAIGWFLFLPRPLYLAMDERGTALIMPGLLRTSYLWIPYDNLVRLEVRQGWLMATGTKVEHQGNLNWLDAARQAGAMVPPWVNLHFQSGIASSQIAAPLSLLDELARDEIELWMYRQGK